jgi:hypothetical protein
VLYGPEAALPVILIELFVISDGEVKQLFVRGDGEKYGDG